MGQAVILLFFEEAGLKEHGILTLSTTKTGWQNLIENVVGEACKHVVVPEEC
jgi:hypothetical protein